MEYTSKAVKDKAYVIRRRNMFAVYKFDYVKDGSSSSSKVKDFHTFDEANAYAAELNDWQHLGDKGEEVYKGNAIFNKAFKVQPWEHCYLSKDKVFFFVWDTRELTRVAVRPANLDDKAVAQYLHVELSDNHKPICLHGKWLQKSELLKQPINFKTDKQKKDN